MTTTAAWAPFLPTETNVVDMRFDKVRLTVCTDEPLPSAAWGDIGYAAKEIERLAKAIDVHMNPPEEDESS